jgi:signal transduction histidine kinase
MEKGLTIDEHPLIIAAWMLVLGVLFIQKGILASMALSPPYLVPGGNILSGAVLIISALTTTRCLRKKPQKLCISALSLLLAAVTAWSFYEVIHLLPVFHERSFSAIVFLTISLLTFSLVLAFFSLYLHAALALFYGAVNLVYIMQVMRKLESDNAMLLAFLFLQLLVTLLFFRSIRIIRKHHEKTRKGLRKQQELNRLLAASGKRLMEQEKLVSITRLSAGLGHEINNPLTYLQGNLFYLRHHLENIDKAAKGTDAEADIEKETASMKQLLDEYEHGFREIGSVVGWLKRFTEKSSEQPQFFDLSRLALACVETERTILGPSFTIKLEEEPAIELYGKPEDFLSLCATLIEQSAASFENSPKEKKLISLSIYLKEHNSVMMVFQDNGEGVAAASLLDGSYLRNSVGMAMCRSIVLEYGGTLESTSLKGEGSTVTIEIDRKIQLHSASEL